MFGVVLVAVTISLGLHLLPKKRVPNEVNQSLQASNCSELRQSKHWRPGHKFECVETKVATNQTEATKKAHDQQTDQEMVRYLEEELAKSKNEIALLKSESNKWAMPTISFVSRRINSFMRQSDEHQSECAVLKRELEEQRKLVQRLKLRDNEAQIARRKVEEISEELVNALNDVDYATSRADIVESECVKLKTELQEQRRLVQRLQLEQDEAQLARRKVEEIRKELVDALNEVEYATSRAAIAEAKLSDLEEEIRSSDDKSCAICLTDEKDMAFGCGHMTCVNCGLIMSTCPICRKLITSRLKLFPG